MKSVFRFFPLLAAVLYSLSINAQDCPTANMSRDGSCVLVQFNDALDAHNAVVSPAEVMVISGTEDGKMDGVYIAQSMYSDDIVVFTGAGPCTGSDYGDVVSGTFSFSQSGMSCTYDVQGLLPVKFSYFNAIRRGQNIAILDWATSTEIDNEGFYLERSFDGHIFEEFAFVPGEGNSSEEITYQFKDRDPYNGINYYRLKQIDFNGAYRYSEVVELDFSSIENTTIEYDLGSDQLTIRTSEELNNVEIFDISGIRVFKGRLDQNNFEHKLETQSLTSGHYVVITYSKNGNSSTNRFMKI